MEFPLTLPPANRAPGTGDPAEDHNATVTALAALADQVGDAMDGKAGTGHTHDARYVRTVNGTGPDGAGNVTVEASGGSAGIPVGDVAVIEALTQAEYDALGSKSATTLYLITGP